jgi:hypothetical protein
MIKLTERGLVLNWENIRRTQVMTTIVGFTYSILSTMVREQDL